MGGPKEKQRCTISRDELMEMEDLRYNINEKHYLTFKIMVLLIPNLFLDIWSVYMSGAAYKVYYLTWIGITTVTISLFLSSYITYARVHDLHVSTRLLKISHVIFEIAFTYQLIITSVYWMLLHDTYQDYFNEHGLVTYIYSWWNHSGPMACMIIQFLLCKKEMFLSDLSYLLIYGLAYVLNNFVQTKLFDREPYFFLTWEGFDSIAAVIIIIFTVTLVVYYMIAKVSQIVFNKNRIKL